MQKSLQAITHNCETEGNYGETNAKFETDVKLGGQPNALKMGNLCPAFTAGVS